MTAEKIARAIHAGAIPPMLSCLIVIAITATGLITR